MKLIREKKNISQGKKKPQVDCVDEDEDEE